MYVLSTFLLHRGFDQVHKRFSFPFYVESIEIPYEGGATLPGHFYYYSKKDSVYNNGDGNIGNRNKETEKKLSSLPDKQEYHMKIP